MLGLDLFLTSIFYSHLLSVEQMEPTVVEIVERSLEFCLLHLENSSYMCDDFGLLVSSISLVLYSWRYHSEFEYAFGTLVAGALIHNVGLNSEKLLRQTLTRADGWTSSKKKK